MKIEFQDHIDDYLLGRMVKEARKSFEQELVENKEFREQTEFTKNVIAATKSRNDKLSKTEAWEGDNEWQHKRQVASEKYRKTGSGYDYTPVPSSRNAILESKSSSKYYLYWVSGVAAIFIAGFFLFNNMLVGSKSEMEILYNPSQMEYSSTRGGDNYESIEKMLVSKDYKDALSKIEKEMSSLQRQDVAVDSIENIEQREYEKIVIKYNIDKLCLMKVYALIGLNKRKEAIDILEELRSGSSNFKEHADSLYHLIE